MVNVTSTWDALLPKTARLAKAQIFIFCLHLSTENTAEGASPSPLVTLHHPLNNLCSIFPCSDERRVTELPALSQLSNVCDVMGWSPTITTTEHLSSGKYQRRATLVYFDGDSLCCSGTPHTRRLNTLFLLAQLQAWATWPSWWRS